MLRNKLILQFPLFTIRYFSNQLFKLIHEWKMKKYCLMRERKRSFSIACGSVLRASKKKVSHLPFQKVEYRDVWGDGHRSAAKNPTNILDEHSHTYVGQSRFCIPTSRFHMRFDAIFFHLSIDIVGWLARDQLRLTHELIP